MSRRRGSAWLVVLLLPGCEDARPPEPHLSGEFGIFFGGQIQERRDIPFELDRSQQIQGFRVDFGAPLVREATVRWWIDRPEVAVRGKKRGGTGGSPDEEETGAEEARVPRGQTRFEHTVPFAPGDPLGLWNVRVLVDGKVAIDRPFEVYDRRARERASERERDGG